MARVSATSTGEREGGLVFADSRAARMLNHGLNALVREKGISRRQLAKRLNYKQSVVLSHMASGRVAIPLERAPEIATAVGLDRGEFVDAVFEQRYPEAHSTYLATHADWSGHIGAEVVSDLESRSGRAFAALCQEQRAVIAEAMSDSSPRRRWLTIHEAPMIAQLREVRPNATTEGFRREDLAAVAQALGTEGHRKGKASS